MINAAIPIAVNSMWTRVVLEELVMGQPPGLAMIVGNILARGDLVPVPVLQPVVQIV
jgi:hypothetical protein